MKLRYIVEDVPDRLYHTMGSNAGAGSGEFHTYRHSRRREQERLARIDEDHERTTKDKELQVGGDALLHGACSLLMACSCRVLPRPRLSASE